jgi:hypothetical protein
MTLATTHTRTLVSNGETDDSIVGLRTYPVSGDYVYTGFESDASYGIVIASRSPSTLIVQWFNADRSIYGMATYSINCWYLSDDLTWTFRGEHSYGYTEDGDPMVEYTARYMLTLAYYVVISHEAYCAQMCELLHEEY